jgi:hypothetical protein
MVNVSVNLLKNHRTLSERDYLRERQMLRLSVLVMVVVVFISIALSIWNFLLSRRLLSIEEAISTASREMQGLTEANAQQIYLKSRLKLITTFLDERSISREALQSVFSLNIPGATISSAAFLSDSIIAVQVTARSASILNDVISYYQGDSSFFTQVVSRGVSRAKDGTYQLELELTIPKGGSNG